jgi:putative transport protein
MEFLQRLTGANEVALAILVLSIISVTGLALSAVKLRGIGIGVTGVLFAGLFFGHLGWHIEDQVLEFLKEFGLILFVFTIGLEIGPGFFASLRREGLPVNLCAAAIVTGGAGVTVLVAKILGIAPLAAAGLFSGATTNTPSLGAVQQAITMLPHAEAGSRGLPALAYAAAYPGGVIGIILCIALLPRLLGIDTLRETEAFENERKGRSVPLRSLHLRITNANLSGLTVSKIPGLQGSGIVISRIRNASTGEIHVATGNESLHGNDTLLAIGTPEALEALRVVVGEESDDDLLGGAPGILHRRIIVTRKEPLGKSLRELALHTAYGVLVTRIQRGGLELPGDPSTRLQYGDALMVVGDVRSLDQVSAILGNSPKELGITNYLPVFLGIALGVMAGLVPIVLPGLPASVRLGLAGGPLVVAILLSRVGQIGRVVWYMPSEANLALREMGIVLFLACVGLKAGAKFLPTLMSPEGLSWLAGGFCITLLPLLLVGVAARLILKLNYVTLSGLIAGSMTDPPALAFANAMIGGNSASISYAAVYPLTMLLRILCAQLLVLLFA